MNWWHRPELLDRLAGEYVVGTLHGGARRRFEAVMAAHPAVARAAARWAQDLQPLDAAIGHPAADPALWSSIERRLFGGAAASGATAGRTGAAGRPGPAAAGAGGTATAGWRRWLGPRPAATLAFGVAAGIAATLLLQPGQRPGGAVATTQLPESYVGVLATADGRPGLIVSSLRRGRTLDIKLVNAVPLPAGRQWVLWTIDAQGRRQPVIALPPLAASFTSVALPADSETLFSRAVELAVSAESAATSVASLAAPTEPFAWRGLCGKLWRVAPPAAAGAAASAPASAAR
jgi:anti-sigma-K factor RskA